MCLDLIERSSGYSTNCDESLVQKTSLSMFWEYSPTSANLASDWMRAKITLLGTEDDCLYLPAAVLSTTQRTPTVILQKSKNILAIF